MGNAVCLCSRCVLETKSHRCTVTEPTHQRNANKVNGNPSLNLPYLYGYGKSDKRHQPRRLTPAGQFTSSAERAFEAFSRVPSWPRVRYRVKEVESLAVKATSAAVATTAAAVATRTAVARQRIKFKNKSRQQRSPRKQRQQQQR